MQTENDITKPKDSPKQETGEGCSGATCSALDFIAQELGAPADHLRDAARNIRDERLIKECGLSVDIWLVEREANARELAATKSGDDARGWLEDAAYFRIARLTIRQNTWQSVDKAPPNVTVLVWDRGDVFPAHYSPGYQRWVSAFTSGFKPTHWMPLIDPPNDSAHTQKERVRRSDNTENK